MSTNKLNLPHDYPVNWNRISDSAAPSSHKLLILGGAPNCGRYNNGDLKQIVPKSITTHCEVVQPYDVRYYTEYSNTRIIQMRIPQPS